MRTSAVSSASSRRWTPTSESRNLSLTPRKCAVLPTRLGKSLRAQPSYTDDSVARSCRVQSSRWAIPLTFSAVIPRAMMGVLDIRTIHPAIYPHGMRRRTTVAVLLIVVGLFSFSFFAPVLPANHSYTSETVCPVTGQLCSTNNSLHLPGYGSFTYLLLGVGGWWETSNGYHVFSSNSSHQVFGGQTTSTSSTTTITYIPGTTTTTPGSTTVSVNTTPQQGGVETITRTATTTVNYPAGTTTMTECSRTATVTVTAIGVTSAQTTVTYTVTTTVTNYGSTTTVTTCAATTTTATITQGGG